MGSPHYIDGFKVAVHHDALDQPIRWTKPRRIFVNSMSDLFHPHVPDEFLDEVFGIMLACAYLTNHRHTFQVLTKRPKRMQRYLTADEPAAMLERWARAGNRHVTLDDPDQLLSERVCGFCSDLWTPDLRSRGAYLRWGHPENLWPLPDVWLGVSVENQRRADERIPLLLQNPAASTGM